MAKIATERLFQNLVKKDGSQFSQEIVDNWYIARHFVLNNLEQWEKDSPSHHYILDGGSDIVCAVARQIALVSHYTDYVEEKRKNRTILTFINVSDADNLIQKLRKEEYLCNLISFCKYTVNRGTPVNPESFLDIEIEIQKDNSYSGKYYVKIDETQVPCIIDESDSCIEISKAKMANMVYCVGSDLDNLSPDDPNTSDRYQFALQVFYYQMSDSRIDEEWRKVSYIDQDKNIDYFKIRNILSNVFCADCFESRVRSILKDHKVKKDFWQSIMKDSSIIESWVGEEKVLSALARNEHARWCVEKLIMGFFPLSNEQKYKDEILFGADREDYRKELKNKINEENCPAHIDLCSYDELQRVNPGDMKYDCFLMLAMPHILKTYKGIKS